MSSSLLENISDPKNPKVDIVFVHGFLGDKVKTWTADNDTFWPKLLAKDITNARISAFGYDSSVAKLSGQVSQNGMKNNAGDLCARLTTMRSASNTDDLPIVFVAHSLGGLICAQVIVMGDRNPTETNLQIIAKYTKGMVFLGTPFEGSTKAKWADKCVDILGLFKDVTKKNLEDLWKGASTLDELGDAFPSVLTKRDEPNSDGKISVAFCYEQWKTNGLMIVDMSSATIPGRGDKISLKANHHNICKFTGSNDENYKLVLGAIKKVITGPVPEDKAGVNMTFHNRDNTTIQNQGYNDIGTQNMIFNRS